MTRIPAVAATILVCGLVSTSRAQDRIAWQFAEKQEFFLKQELKQTQTVTVAGEKKESRTTQTSLIRYNVVRINEAGLVEMLMTIESVSHGGVDGKVSALTDRMKGAEFQLTIDTHGKLIRLDGYSDFVKKIAEGDDRRANLFRAILSEDSFKTLAIQTFGIGPGRPVERGESWQQKMKLALGPFGSIAMTRVLKHAGTGAETNGTEFIRLDVTGTAAYELPTGDFPGFPFKVTKGTFTFQGLNGSGTFDPQAGRLKSLSMQLDMTGDLTIQLGKSEQDVMLVQQQQSTMTVSTKRPELSAKPGVIKSPLGTD
ncbi:MAG: DUF6263 family protein [Planctomycetota bacterium]|nr:DUF6263 family protein [Planctomycetota bacterium]